MLQERVADFGKFVEPDRVRREAYTDPQIFELEMQRIHERVWIYCGHLSQIPKAGDYYTVQIGRQPMIMVRRSDGKVSVLYNRCPHRGNMICGDMKGNTGEFFRCSYHAWTFNHDGKLLPLWWYRLVRLTQPGVAELVSAHGSGDVVSLARSDGFIEIPPSDAGSGPWPFYSWEA